jgi:hypothetical protein
MSVTKTFAKLPTTIRIFPSEEKVGPWIVSREKVRVAMDVESATDHRRTDNPAVTNI